MEYCVRANWLKKKKNVLDKFCMYNSDVSLYQNAMQFWLNLNEFMNLPL